MSSIKQTPRSYRDAAFFVMADFVWQSAVPIEPALGRCPDAFSSRENAAAIFDLTFIWALLPVLLRAVRAAADRRHGRCAFSRELRTAWRQENTAKRRSGIGAGQPAVEIQFMTHSFQTTYAVST